ncbi:MAG: TetR/AcrR family transcriptional regulator [Ktedonobacterales bacterium]|nr:TetR/AcrR family transcriptional regulator [Ktedonobacterales bacterium]
MARPSATAHHILSTFLVLVAERGLAATTTKVLAEAAGVNEVTIFRLFTDKAGVVQAAYDHFDLVGHLTMCAVAIDITSAAHVAEGLGATLRCVRDQLHMQRALVQFGISEHQKYPQLRAEAARGPATAQRILTEALEAARPRLRPEVDVATTVLSWMGFLLITTLWEQNGWLAQPGATDDAHIAALIAPLIDWQAH